MALTAYLQLAEVRAALGVNSVELSDTVLNLPVYEMGLIRELNKLSTSLPAAFSLIADKDPGVRTANEQALYDATKLFSVYAVAKQVGVSLATFAPKDVSDSKASLARFSGEAYKETMARVEQMYSATRDYLADAYDTYTGNDANVANTTPFTTFVASGRSTDPVTGT
jgi:hypothetical protein